MFINYDIILEKKRQVLDKAESRKHQLHLDADEFIDQLKVSLQLPQGHAIDPNGRPLPFILTGFINAAGSFQQSKISSINPNDAHVLRFSVNLLVDSNVNNGEWVTIPVEMWYENGRLIYSSGRYRDHTEILPNSSPSRFLDAADKFKQNCLDEITDRNLE